MLTMACVLLASFFAGAPAPVFSLQVTGDWRVELGPGEAGGVSLAQAASFEITPPERTIVRDERHAVLPLYNPKAGGWVRGAKPRGIQTEECTATGKLYPETLRIKAGPGDAPVVFVEGKDYQIEPFWGTFGRVEGGAIGNNQEVFIDYAYEPDRLDTLAVNTSGEARLFEGVPSLGVVLPGDVTDGFTPVARVWVPGRGEALTEDTLYPIYFDSPGESPEPVAERLLPGTLAKLRSGEALTVVTFGDSVTCGGGVGSDQAQWWQGQFLARLRDRFPAAQLSWKNAGWGGASSAAYMKSPRGSEHDYVRDVLEPEPDLVVIEFVNDAYLDEAGVAEHYGTILKNLRGVGAEVILLTPHLVRPDWMGMDTNKVKEDPRGYVRGLKAFGAANNVAVADASALYCNLWRQGLPYMTLMANAINHPDVRGHKLFADALMGLFPRQ
ncbi:MAG: GDSL-like Lipase/Acylhydrolase [Candidatus Hydrogenedentes bacterium ADurb.Bin101]|nr:MAG: GDSL-like Lipase/Acylhydrolase [Candidatus Hydrogenedentes bacterium ADurb.Bin101]